MKPHDRIAMLSACATDLTLRANVLALCGRDPLYWADLCLWGYDPRHSPPLHPFIPYTFQRPVIRDICQTSRPIVLDKSRDLGATWLVLAALVWLWLFREGGDSGVMTRSGTDLQGGAMSSLFSKIRHIVEYLPAWMRPPYQIVGRPAVLTRLDTGCSIQGSLTIPDAFRGGRLARVFVDEAASVPAMDAVLRSIMDAGPPVLVSTPRGAGGAFAEVIRGERGELNGEHGWIHHRLHYSMIQSRDPSTPEGAAWVNAKRSTRTAEDWAQEQEIDYTASARGRVWPEFSPVRHVYSADEWRDAVRYMTSARIVEGWDFGSGPDALTACVQCAYLESTDTLYLLNYRQWREASYLTVAADYRAMPLPLGRHPDDRVGDIAGKQRDSAQRSWISNLRTEGIDIRGMALPRAEQVRERIRAACSNDHLLLAPICAVRHHRELPSMVEVISQYTRMDGPEPKPKKDIYSHAADALQYVAAVIWPVSRVGTRLQDEPK